MNSELTVSHITENNLTAVSYMYGLAKWACGEVMVYEVSMLNSWWASELAVSFCEVRGVKIKLKWMQ